MRLYADFAEKSLAIVCLPCDRQSFLHESWWEAMAKRYGGDLDKIEAKLRCQKCGARGIIEVREKVVREDKPHDHVMLGVLGAINRKGRRMKKRGEVP